MNDNMPEREAHQELEELLPWYANGRLDSDDRVKVERHLESCSSCREELALDRRLIDEFQSLTPEIDAGWARMRARIAPARKPAPRVPRMFGDFWTQLRQPGVAALAAAQVAFVIFGAGVLLTLSRPTYHALGSSQAPQTANVLVIFRADATVEEVHDTLQAANASVVGGPTATDAYLLSVAPNRRDQALRKLQSDEDVELAQPIDGPGR